MPAIPPPLPLDISDLPRVSSYLGSSRHRNHRGYQIQPVWGHNINDSAEFVAAIRHGISVINGPRTGKDVIRRAAYWYVFSFAEKSYLTQEERESYQELAVKLLGSRRPLLGSWHQHKTNGAADLNLLDPEIRIEPVPHLDRPRTINRLFRLRHASDAWTSVANRAREANGKDLIPAIDPIAETATTGLARLVQLITAHISPQAQSFSAKEIPDALRATGFRAEDWTLSIAGKLAIHRWPNTPAQKKKKAKPFSIAVKELVTWVWLHLSRRRSRAKKPRAPKGPHKEANVIPILRTEPDVRQATSKDTFSP